MSNKKFQVLTGGRDPQHGGTGRAPKLSGAKKSWSEEEKLWLLHRMLIDAQRQTSETAQHLMSSLLQLLMRHEELSSAAAEVGSELRSLNPSSRRPAGRAISQQIAAEGVS